MPHYLLAAFIALIFLLISADWWGELRGAIAVSIPVILYLLRERYRGRRSQVVQELHTTDSILKLAGEREKRLEERESRLREEERDFYQNQLRISRLRSHVLASGYMAMQLACDELLETVREHNIVVPDRVLARKTRGRVLNELHVLEEQELSLDKPEGG